MKILALETTCDETAAAIVDDKRVIHSNILRSQWESVEMYGGVVPEIAARAHLDCIDTVIDSALEQAKTGLQDITAIAATAGPGLIGGILVGVTVAKTMAAVLDIPFIAVNHLEAHALTVRLTDNVKFPYLLLLMSGGHCQILTVKGVGQYACLGSTLDDAAGEAFDKTAKLLDIGFPGGPAIEKHAQQGNPKRYSLPRPLLHRSPMEREKNDSLGCHFSFSGLKTAVRHLVEKGQINIDNPGDVNDACASFQAAVADVLDNRCRNALDYCLKQGIPITACVMAGGVAANQFLRQRLVQVAAEKAIPFVAPPVALCTDNAAMVAWAAIERIHLGLYNSLDFAPRPRWPLEELGETLG